MRTLTDKNKDNVYEVTIVTVDEAGNRGTLDVAIVVYNRGETGWLVFTEGEEDDQAYYSEELVAQVYDPDDHGGDLGEPYEGVNVVTWQWHERSGPRCLVRSTTLQFRNCRGRDYQ